MKHFPVCLASCATRHELRTASLFVLAQREADKIRFRAVLDAR